MRFLFSFLFLTYQTMLSLIKKIREIITPLVAVIITFVVAASVLAIFFYASQAPSASSSKVALGTISERILITGVVVPAKTVDLAFQSGGTIRALNIVVGDHVLAGQTLATLNGAEALARRAQALAALAIQQSQLDSLQKGTRSEEINAARKSVSAALSGGYSAADDAVRNRADQFIGNPRSYNPSLLFLSSNSNVRQSVLNNRVAIESSLQSWNNFMALPTDSLSDSALIIQAQKAEQILTTVANFLDETSTLLTTAIAGANMSVQTIAGYQASISVARSSVSQSLSALNSAESRLSLDVAGATSQTVDAQKASVNAAQAAVSLADAQLSQTIIRAPISGIITRQDGNVGESIAPNQQFLTLMSASRFQIDAYVSETDMAHIKIGDKSSVRLDAYPDDTFDAIIIAVDPASTMQNGASAYKVTAQFSSDDVRIKAGLTANVSVTTGEVDNVLVVPLSAIIKGDDVSSVVLIGANGARTIVPVVLGLRDDTNVQILSGLTEGDTVSAFSPGKQTILNESK